MPKTPTSPASPNRPKKAAAPLLVFEQRTLLLARLELEPGAALLDAGSKRNDVLSEAIAARPNLRACGIDFGVNNTAALAFNTGAQAKVISAGRLELMLGRFDAALDARVSQLTSPALRELQGRKEAEAKGLVVVTTEESCTSKTSFVNDEVLKNISFERKRESKETKKDKKAKESSLPVSSSEAAATPVGRAAATSPSPAAKAAPLGKRPEGERHTFVNCQTGRWAKVHARMSMRLSTCCEKCSRALRSTQA